MAEPIEMSFGLGLGSAQGTMLDGSPDPPWKEAILRGKGRPIVKYRKYRSCMAAMRPFVKLL